MMGVVSLGIGLWLYTTQNEFASFSSGQHLIGSVFLVATGFGVVIVGFLGIVAALWESRIIATVVCHIAHTHPCPSIIHTAAHLNCKTLW